MTTAFDTAILGATGRPVRRLGLSASYWPGKKTIYEAVDCGVTLFFAYGFDFQMIRALRNLFRTGRDRFVVVTGAYNLIWTHTDVRKSCEKRLRQLGTDYLDYFLFLGVMKPREFPARVQEDLLRLREEGKVRGVGVSCHDRRFAGQLIAEGRVDTLMMRYSAAHRGAETDIFPCGGPPSDRDQLHGDALAATAAAAQRVAGGPADSDRAPVLPVRAVPSLCGRCADRPLECRAVAAKPARPRAGAAGGRGNGVHAGIRRRCPRAKAVVYVRRPPRPGKMKPARSSEQAGVFSWSRGKRRPAAQAGTLAFFTCLPSHSVLTDFGRVIAVPRARLSTSWERIPMARDTLKSTV